MLMDTTLTILSDVAVSVTNDATVINRFCNSLIRESVTGKIVVGFDCEWNVDKYYKQTKDVAVIQVSTDDET